MNMKKSSFAIVMAAFVSGIILGASAIAWFSFTVANPSAAAVQGVSKISVQDARSSFNRYFQAATPLNVVLKGFNINKEQLDALNRLSTENPALTGFRVYMGIDSFSAAVGIVVGVDNLGKDNTNSIYRTSAGSSGPCPTICDQSSGITTN
jgi:hypothetical protein